MEVVALTAVDAQTAAGLAVAFALGFAVARLGPALARPRRGEAEWPTVDTLMARRPQTLEASLTLDDAISSGFGQQLFTAFPVVDRDGLAVGLIGLEDVRSVSFDARGVTTIAQVMCTDAGVFVRAGSSVQDVLSSPSFALRGRAVVVGPDGDPVGLLSVTDVRRRMGAAYPAPAAAAAR